MSSLNTEEGADAPMLKARRLVGSYEVMRHGGRESAERAGEQELGADEDAPELGLCKPHITAASDRCEQSLS